MREIRVETNKDGSWSVSHVPFSPPSLVGAIETRRFCVLLDVMGMKQWVEQASAELVAKKISSALGRSRAELNGPEAISIGASNEPSSVKAIAGFPMPGSILFSDSLVLYSHDDSWESFYTIARSARTIVHLFLQEGIPLSGALSVGPMFVHAPSNTFAGSPLGDAATADGEFRKAASPCSHEAPTGPRGGMAILMTKSARDALESVMETRPEWLVAEVPDKLFSDKLTTDMFAWLGEHMLLNIWKDDLSIWPERRAKQVAGLRLRFFARALATDSAPRSQEKFDSTIAVWQACSEDKHRHRDEALDAISREVSAREPRRWTDDDTRRWQVSSDATSRKLKAQKALAISRLVTLGLRDGNGT